MFSLHSLNPAKYVLFRQRTLPLPCEKFRLVTSATSKPLPRKKWKDIGLGAVGPDH